MRSLVLAISIFLLIQISFAAPLQTSNGSDNGGAAPASGTTNVYLNGHMLMKIDDSRTYYFSDYLGSTRIVTDERGQITGKLNYAPFGKQLITGDEEITFTGKEQDSTGLHYFGARYYDPDTGRFTQQDAKYKSSETPYQYANQNPLAYVDPDGNEATVADGMYTLWKVPQGEFETFTKKAQNTVDFAAKYVGQNIDSWISKMRKNGFESSNFNTLTVAFAYSDSGHTAEYDVSSKTMFIYKIMLKQTQTGGWTIDRSRLQTTVLHELMHAYMDTRRGELISSGKQYDMPYDASKNTYNLQEGIADYYASRISDTSTDTEYPLFNSNSAITSRYNRWKNMVSPILDKFGKGGLDWILMHGMSNEEEAHPELYQQRAISQLSARASR